MVKKPKIKIVGCETCLFRDGEPFETEEKDVLRVYCKARYSNVDIDIMNKFCDHFRIKPME